MFHYCGAIKFSTQNHDRRPISYPQPFPIRENSWNTEWFHYETFRNWETKQLRRKIVIIPPPPPNSPLLSNKTFDNWEFLKHRRGPLRHFWALRDKTTSTENRDWPAPLILETFRYQKYSETQECSSAKLFGTGRQLKTTWNRDIHLLAI